MWMLGRATRGVLYYLLLALITTSTYSTSAAGPQTPSCGNYKVSANEIIAGVKFPKGTYQINTFGISCAKIMGSKGLFAKFLKLKDKDPLPKPWRYLADAVGAPKFSSGPGVGFRVQSITPTSTQISTPTPVAAKVTFITDRQNWGVVDPAIPQVAYKDVVQMASDSLFRDLPPENPSVKANIQFESEVQDNIKNAYSEQISYVVSKFSGYLKAGESFDLVGYSTKSWGVKAIQNIDKTNEINWQDLLTENPKCDTSKYGASGRSIGYLKNPLVVFPQLNCRSSNPGGLPAHELTHGIQSTVIKSLTAEPYQNQKNEYGDSVIAWLRLPNFAFGPEWLVEGQAEAAGDILNYYDGSLHPYQAFCGYLRGFIKDPRQKSDYVKSLEKGTNGGNDHYSVGMLVSNYLIARSGWKKSLQVWALSSSLTKESRPPVSDPNSMESFRAAFKVIYGQSLDDFYKEVQSYLEWLYDNRDSCKFSVSSGIKGSYSWEPTG
jgi:hypothetical protein